MQRYFYIPETTAQGTEYIRPHYVPARQAEAAKQAAIDAILAYVRKLRG